MFAPLGAPLTSAAVHVDRATATGGSDACLGRDPTGGNRLPQGLVVALVLVADASANEAS